MYILSPKSAKVSISGLKKSLSLVVIEKFEICRPTWLLGAWGATGAFGPKNRFWHHQPPNQWILGVMWGQRIDFRGQNKLGVNILVVLGTYVSIFCFILGVYAH